MDKASKVLRRSSVRLRSIGSGHGELNLVISELKEVRATAKAFLNSQHTASLELLNWAHAGENRAIQETFIFLNELNSLWSDTQKDFVEHIKDFKTQFELILEGEKHVDQARNAVELCDQRESKLRKELKKAKKCTPVEMQDLEKRLCEAARAKEVAQLEVDDRLRENEAVKMIRVKESLLKLSESYVELANKCKVIFEAFSDVAHQLPDVHGEDLQNIRYTGHEASKQAVSRAKENVNQHCLRSHNVMPCAPQPEDPPPPYSICPPYNPFFRQSYSGGSSAGYDVPDGREPPRNVTAACGPRQRLQNFVNGGPSRQRSQPSTSAASNNRPRRRGFFSRASFRRSDTSGDRGPQRNENNRPHSLPGPSRSTNPFEEETPNRQEDDPSMTMQTNGLHYSERRQSSGESLVHSLNQTRLS